eukprot:2546911-Pyramimonas_sp.AAC.1
MLQNVCEPVGPLLDVRPLSELHALGFPLPLVFAEILGRQGVAALHPDDVRNLNVGDKCG